MRVQPSTRDPNPSRTDRRAQAAWLHGIGGSVWSRLTLAALIFLIDLLLPLGVAGGVPYVLVVLLTPGAPRPRAPLLTAAGCSLLTVAGYFLSVPSGTTWMVLVNRVLALFAIWVVAFVSMHRNRAAAALIDREARLRAIVATDVAGIITIDEAGTIESFNRGAERMFGYAADDVIGRNVMVLMPAPHREDHDRHLRDYLARGAPGVPGVRREIRGRRKDGSTFPAELSFSEMQVGRRRRFTGIVQDLTDRKLAEAKLATAERLAAVGELAAGVAHEINNPINTILNCAQLIADGDDAAETLDDIKHESLRIASIVRDLLDFSKEHADEPSAAHVADVVQRTLSLVGRRIEHEDIEITTAIPEDLPMVRGRARQLQQVLLNLVLNARDALKRDTKPEPKRIHVSAAPIPHGDRVAVQMMVRDNGPGIAERDLGRVFEPFFTTKRGGGGTGLGLSVSRGLVESTGGTLEASSAVGEFAEFRVTLPAVLEDDADDAIDAPAPEARATESRAAARRRRSSRHHR